MNSAKAQLFRDRAMGARKRERTRGVLLDSTLLVAKGLLQQGEPIDSIRTKVKGIIIRQDVVTALEGEPHSALVGVDVGGTSDTFTFRGRPTFLYLEQIDPSRPMTFEEAFFRVVTDYQPPHKTRLLVQR